MRLLANITNLFSWRNLHVTFFPRGTWFQNVRNSATGILNPLPAWEQILKIDCPVWDGTNWREIKIKHLSFKVQYESNYFKTSSPFGSTLWKKNTQFGSKIAKNDTLFSGTHPKRKLLKCAPPRRGAVGLLGIFKVTYSNSKQRTNIHKYWLLLVERNKMKNKEKIWD